MIDNSQFRPKKEKKIRFKNRIKKYFTAKPKTDFWFWAFITLFVFRWVAPTTILMIIPFQVGLIAPETNVNYTNISMNIANNLVKPMETLNNAGRNISKNNLTIGLTVSTIIGYLTYIIYASLFTLIINLFRYGISYFYRRFKQRN
jgi:hypothetical protein